jgi:hypothetical protein
MCSSFSITDLYTRNSPKTTHYAASHAEHVAHLIIVDSAAPKFKDTIFLFDNVFPEGTERQQSLNFAEEMGDKLPRSDRAAQVFKIADLVGERAHEPTTTRSQCDQCWR